VKASSRDRIIAELERLFILAGATDYDSGMEQFGKLLQKLQEGYHPMRSKHEFASMLDELPEPSWLMMRFILGSFNYAHQLARYGLKHLANIGEEDLPEIPRGRPGLDAFSKAQIVAKIGRWHVAGYTLDQAKKRAALHFHVSESTVQRAWDDRANRGAVDFRSVVKFLTEDEEGVTEFSNLEGVQEG
jgi:hypothetical protein